MSVMRKKIFLCGDYVNAYKCDQCKEEHVCSFQHWPERNFTLCCNCLEAAYKDLFHLPLPSVPTKKKKQLSVKVRLAVFKRDSYKCRYCGSDEDLEADHVIPESRGGAGTVDNLVTACRSCNSRKGARTPEESGNEIKWQLMNERVRCKWRDRKRKGWDIFRWTLTLIKMIN